ncbi:MAG: glycoside hydrolase family 32 protein [Clostridia bacterium]|nr:glycoside hydrolase family 32 protein [Clostridia bacterium]
MSNFSYHFEQRLGFMNDPNGCVYFGGRWHTFFQYHEAGRNTTTWWGHAVSDDLLTWEELPPALKHEPNSPYEEFGCLSGSSIVKDGRLYLFYTSATAQKHQSISLAYTDDGVNFEKHPSNPIVPCPDFVYEHNFRDPKVFLYDGKYYMLVGAEFDRLGRILCYISEDLVSWSYASEFYVSDKYEPYPSITLECPDFFPLGDRWVLKFSSQHHRKEIFVLGKFDGKAFTPETSETLLDGGEHLYAMQTFANVSDRTVMLGWMWSWEKPLTPGYETRTGTMCIPREFWLHDGKIYSYPVKEAQALLKQESKFVKLDGTTVTVLGKDGKSVLVRDMRECNGVREIERVDILEDSDAVEIFINGGEASITQWLI